MLGSELRVAVFSPGIRRIARLDRFLGASEILYRPSIDRGERVDAVVGWGRKNTAQRAEEFAQALGRPLFRLEDGFFRSVRTGGQDQPLSVIVDDLGIYYDAHAPSRLEAILAAESQADPLADAALLERARAARARVLAAGLSKYNDAPVELPEWLAALSEPFVLVVDQTYGDASVAQGHMAPEDFDRMLEAALAEHPDALVVVKTHPEVARGKKRGYLTDVRRHGRRVRLLFEHTNPVRVLERTRHVYVGTSQLGFEALSCGKPVSCFGAPFYAGWGLTDDRAPPLARRTRQRSLEELLAAAWILYPRYVHPVSGWRCELEDVLSHLELQRARFAENAGVVRAYGFTWWKRPFVERYLEGPSTELHFEDRLGADGSIPAGTTRAVVWGRLGPAELEERCQKQGVPLARMEDGFLRSTGLGADLTAPASLVLDRAGIYYDPERASDLERILLHHEFTLEEKARARALRERLVELRLSKYNPPTRGRVALADVGGRRVLFVPGQVEGDESVVRGGAGISSNDELVRAVRAAHPDAYLLYRPHPDVVSKNRKGALSSAGREAVDQVAMAGSLEDFFALADEVHTLTSLVGFEALLRELPVSVYGQPFYAGWGLTRDRVPVPRRTRRLELDELVAGALLLYPRYYSYSARAFVQAEDVVFELDRDRRVRSGIPPLMSWPVRQVRKLWEWGQEVRRVR